MSSQIIVRILVFLAAWAFYTFISDPASKIDKMEALLFALVISVVAPHLFRHQKQATEPDGQKTATIGTVDYERGTPRIFWVLWITCALVLLLLSILFWPNWGRDEKWSYIWAVAVVGGGWAIERIVRKKRCQQRLAGVLTFEEMARRSQQHIENVMNSEEEKSRDIAIRQLDRNPEWFEAWRRDHHERLKRVAESSTRQDQVIKLRRELVNLVESGSAAQPFLRDAFTEEDKRLLATKLNHDMEFNDVMTMEFQLYVFSEASSRCLRLIALELQDARKNDWFGFYCNIYGQFIEHLYKEMIAQARDEVYALGPLVPVTKALVNETKEKIFQGFNWDYDKEGMEQALSANMNETLTRLEFSVE
jgi:hypothetical protein